MKNRSILYSTVQFIFGGSITLLIIPASGLFALIKGMWKIMDRVLEFIEKKESWVEEKHRT